MCVLSEKLEQLLAVFAEQHQGSLEGMLQWPQLLQMKKKRDAVAHPSSAPILRQELTSGNPDLMPVRGALEVLLSIAPGEPSISLSLTCVKLILVGCYTLSTQ